MSIVEQINNLTIDAPKKDNQFQKYESALKEYHSLVDAGILVARGNNVQQTYKPLEFAFNNSIVEKK